MSDWDSLHHANIVVGEVERLRTLSSFESLNFPIKGNPDVIQITTETFGIDESRRLSEWASLKPLLSDRKVSLIEATSITIEAQNALLKVLEEPPIGTYFFFFIPSQNNLIPTLLSRSRIINSTVNTDKNKEAKEFIKMSLSERLKFIKEISKNDDKEPIRVIIRQLENILDQEQSATKKRVLLAKKYSASRGSSPKMLLEWLAISIR